jgi:DNA-binding transcriptional regulator LsrR (DeoR family)
MNAGRTHVHTTTAVRRAGISDADYRLCVHASMLYYQDGLTQSEIGEKLGYSRIKINRVLSMAREFGIIEIRVKIPPGWHLDLETQLIHAFDLRDAVVVESAGIGQPIESALAAGAATWLSHRLVPGMRVGLGIGRTISRLPETFHVDQRVDCTFIEVVGSAYAQDWDRFDVTSKMAELAGGSREILQAPGIVTNPALGALLAKEPLVVDALNKARESDIIIQSVGPADTSAILFQSGVLGPDDLQALHDQGAVGDALAYYYDIQGNPIECRTDSNLIGIDLDALKRVPFSVLAAGGVHKVDPILGGLRGGYFNVLVTDEATAQAVLRRDVESMQ